MPLERLADKVSDKVVFCRKVPACFPCPEEGRETAAYCSPPLRETLETVAERSGKGLFLPQKIQHFLGKKLLEIGKNTQKSDIVLCKTVS